jgi:hypothetical protein
VVGGRRCCWGEAGVRPAGLNGAQPSSDEVSSWVELARSRQACVVPFVDESSQTMS